MSRHIKRLTLTSKKNWWMVELDEEAESSPSIVPPHSATPGENTPQHTQQRTQQRTPRQLHRQTPRTYESTSHSSAPIYRPPTNPTLVPMAAGSASELFQCVVKKPNVVQIEINGEMQSNARDVTTQFLAELRVYTTLARHRNICAFLGALENVGMVLEYLEGRTLYDKVGYHDQLLDGLTHLHSYGLSHGDLSLLNIQVTRASDTVKLFDFGRSVHADSRILAPDDDADDEFAPPPAHPPPPPPTPSRFAYHGPSTPAQAPQRSARKVERIYPGTRPFSAPEILRGECADARLADAYSFGMILVCLDRGTLVDVKPWEQRKDKLPNGFLDGLEVFGARCEEYLRRCDQGRRRLAREDMMGVDVTMVDGL
ncbi:kinase-like protein [Epithele typhae]|uniref:kinase-like protein n=1 Tax=Epithele typhae TaxID=378194 RepID=UPI0020089453|nr:kinase-like protein [Epithele typhae]KAH9942427.1 kinase-like protein [Epithele typhae]